MDKFERNRMEEMVRRLNEACEVIFRTYMTGLPGINQISNWIKSARYLHYLDS